MEDVVKPAELPPGPLLGASMPFPPTDRPGPAAMASGPVSFGDLLRMLSDLHDKQVHGLEAEVAAARELLSQARSRRHEPPAALEPEETGCACLPGAVNSASLRGAGAELAQSPGDALTQLREDRSLREVAQCPSRSNDSAGLLAKEVAEDADKDLKKQSFSQFDSVSSNLSRWRIESDKIKGLDLFMDKLSDTNHRLDEGRRSRLAHKIVKTIYFDTLSYALIIANSIFIGASMQNQLTRAIDGREGDKAFVAVETAFVVWFAVELLLKLLAEDVQVFLGPDRLWNLLDLVLVVSAIGQLAAESGAPNISVTRNVRLFRVVRILRVVRVVRVCQSLRVMIFSILRSLDALFWVLVVLAFFMYIFAMAFMHAAIEHFRDNKSTWISTCLGNQGACSDDAECAGKCEHLTWLSENLGSLYKTMLVLFQSITGGCDWAEVYDELHLIDSVHGYIFVVFIYFMVFLVLNVVVGTVVDVTSGVSRRDRERLVNGEIKQLEEYTKDIKEFFESADTDKSGQLSFAEFSRYLQDPKVKAYFQTLDLDTRQADVLFTLLDHNESGEVGIGEFLDGCLRLKGEARNLDINLIIYKLEHIMKGTRQLLQQNRLSLGSAF